MDSLPHSVEEYLLEAGFSQTEILVLKKLLQEDALTLRELASKTGKSTGVLDLAIKKLLRKKIVEKKSINDYEKFALTSMQAIVKWMEQDMKEKRDSLLRRHQNFETFIATLKLDKSRPEIEYFSGENGIKQAYLHLLSFGKEMLHYLPVTTTAENDPLRDFHVSYFRERRSKGIFSRV